MRAYQIQITLADGRRLEWSALAAHGIDAMLGALEAYPEACRISTRCLA